MNAAVNTAYLKKLCLILCYYETVYFPTSVECLSDLVFQFVYKIYKLKEESKTDESENAEELL